jgi:hypothetical protein
MSDNISLAQAMGMNVPAGAAVDVLVIDSAEATAPD